MTDPGRPPAQTSDQIGTRGELIAALVLSRPVLGRYRRPLFAPTHLGGKYPAADFLVDVLSASSVSTGFFFVQVKATTRRPGGGHRLPITADPSKLGRLARLPVPTYVVGVSVATEQAYLVAAFGPGRARSRSIPTRFPLASDAVRIALYREVASHWTGHGRRFMRTRFADV